MAHSADRGKLSTELANEATHDLDALTSEAALALVQAEDRKLMDAVEAARPEITRAIDLVTEKLRAGGRLIYVGAGTSGRLGLLDAVECPPTFHTDPADVQAILAGGDGAFLRSVEGAEDDTEAAREQIQKRAVCEDDVVFGITAGGTTPFVHAALDEARSLSAATIFFACVSSEEVPDEADLSIRVITGPEVLAGSTRLKAGTATKLVLNSITTIAMTRLGRVHGNQMVDVSVTNAKLRDRAERLVMELAGVERERAAGLLVAAEDRVKVAVVMHRHGLELEDAHQHLLAHRQVLRDALAHTPT